MEIKVGAIVLSAGYEAFDPELRGDYGYGKMENVVTSLDFELRLPGFSAWVPDRLSRAATAIVHPYAAPIPRSR
jgi:hypothetical protein